MHIPLAITSSLLDHGAFTSSSESMVGNAMFTRCASFLFVFLHLTFTSIPLIYRKLATYIAMAGTGFHCVFRMDYGDQEHCFSGVQRWYRRKVDGIILGGDGVKAIETARKEKQSNNER